MKSTKVAYRKELYNNMNINQNINQVENDYIFSFKRNGQIIKKKVFVARSSNNLNTYINFNSNEVINNNDNNNEIRKKIRNKKKNKKKKNKPLKHNAYSLILINANNETNAVPYQSDYIIDNFDYDEAIIYEDRSYCRIFFIILISNENILNMIFFNPPLEFKPIRFAILIFNFACDYALNALFYLSDNISDRYHYEGIYKELYSIVNNFTISLTSTIVSFSLVFFFNALTESTEKIEKLFRDQEELLKKDEKYKVNNEIKIEIRNKIKDIIRCLKIKIIIFIVSEFLVLFFFFYYATAFCQVYKNTQVSWILDCISSYVISLGITLGFSLIFSLIYKLSIKFKNKFLYEITKFLV